MESVDLRRIKEALSIISTERNEKIGDDLYRDSFLHSFAKSVVTGLENSNEILADLSPSTSLSLSSFNSDWNYATERNPTHSENEGQSLSLPESFDDPIAETVAPPPTTSSRSNFNSVRSLTKTIDKCESCVQLNFELSQLRDQLKSRAYEMQELDAKLHSVTNIASINDRTNAMQLAALQQAQEKAAVLLEAETALRRTCEEKASRFDRVMAENESLKAQLAEMQATVQQQRDALQALTLSEQASRSQAADSDKLREILALDKAFLQQELRQCETRCDEKARQAESEHSKLLSQELKVAQLTDQLLTLQLTARSGFDERMEREMHRLREESQREMDLLKSATKESADREIRLLRETVQTLEAANEQLRRGKEALQAELALLQREGAAGLLDRGNELSELRAELRIKSFELTALGVHFEEKSAHLRKAESELDMTRQEVAAHKVALGRMEREAEQRAAALSDELERATSRLRAYEALEQEIDGAVMRAAANTGAAEVVLDSVRGIPCSPERRVRQAVQLAQRLLETEAARDSLQQRLTESELLREQLQRQKETAEQGLARVAQPTSYLVGKLRDEEGLRVALQSQLEEARQQLDATRRSLQQASEENLQLRQRLLGLLQQRGELQGLRQMLSQLQQKQQQRRGSEEEDSGTESSSSSVREAGVQEARAKRASHIPLRTHSPVVSPPQPQKQPSPPPEVPLSPSVPAVSPGLSLQVAAQALQLSPEVLRQMTTPPKQQQLS